MKLSARDPDFCFNLMVQTQSATAVAEAAHTQDTLIIIHAAFPAMDVFQNTLLEPVKQNEETTKKDLMMLVLPFAKFMKAKVDDMGPDILSITSLIDEEAVLKDNLAYVCRALKVDKVTVSAAAAEGDKADACPGNPGVFLEKVEDA